MAFKPVNVVDTIKEVVQAIGGARFEFGHYQEVFNNLSRLESANIESETIYPLVYLVCDFEETMKAENQTIETRLQLFIITRTLSEFYAEDRKEERFKPILYPIYQSLIEALKKHKEIRLDNGLGFHKHTKIDHYFWGKDEKAFEGNGFFDCIELKDTEIQFIIHKC